MHDEDKEDEYAFVMKSASKPETVKVTVAGIEVEIMIDSTSLSRDQRSHEICAAHVPIT